jgi:glycosyltransferase involved in cell wall biosynthesis
MLDEKGPTFSMMAKTIMELGYNNKKTLVIMPFHNKYDFLEKHLNLLKAQTVRRFDLLIVGSSGSDEKTIWRMVSEKKPDFAVILCKRFEDNGAAGGFYTGERFAIENGYDRIIMAEEDALPVDNDVVEKLIKQSEKGSEVVTPTCSFMIGDRIVFKASGVHFYSLVTKDLLLKAGLHFIPVYLGAEDWIFFHQTPKPVQVDASVTHPAWLSVFANFERNVGYRVNHAIFTCTYDPLTFLYNFIALIPAHLIFGTNLAKSAGMHILLSIPLMRFGKKAIFKNGKMDLQTRKKYDCTVVPVELPGCQPPVLVLGENKSKLDLIRFIFRKKALFYPVKNPVIFLGMVFAKEAWIATPAGDYMIARNPNPLTHALKLIAFAVLSPIMLLVGLIIWPTLVVRRPKTRGFGVSDLIEKK